MEFTFRNKKIVGKTHHYGNFTFNQVRNSVNDFDIEN
jgi:hypothetical protein